VIYGRVGCLLQADVVSLDGLPALAQLIKVPQEPHGIVALGVLTVPRASCSAVLQVQAVEDGVTGTREAMAHLEEQRRAHGAPVDLVLPHPYAPELESRPAFLVSDGADYDDEFAGHPLAHARRFLARAISTSFVDPELAAPATVSPRTGARAP